ncbi:TPA: hypothetical protein ACHTFG_004695, partial [Salmonella enterica subsp. enterica serovar Blockley]
ICSGAKMMAGQRAYLLTQRYLNDEACLCITEVKVTHNAVNTWDLRAPAPTPSHLRATVAIKGSFRGAEF